MQSIRRLNQIKGNTRESKATEMEMLFFKHGFISSGFLNLTPSEAYKEATENDAILLDVRESIFTTYKKFDVPMVLYFPKSIISENFTALPDNEPLIVADSVGLRSREAIEFLISKGFKNVANLAGGIVDWEKDGLPVMKDKAGQLDGSCMCQLKHRHRATK